MNVFYMNVSRLIVFVLVCPVVALLIGLSGCERIVSMAPDAQTPSVMGKEISIGIAVALTGEFAEPYGLPMQRGLALAREEINAMGDLNLTFITVDPQSTVEGGKAAVQQLMDQGVPAIVGIGTSTQVKEIFPIVQENGVIAYSPISSGAGLSSIGKFVFRTGVPVDVQNANGVAVTHAKLGYQKVAMIYDELDFYSTSSNEALNKVLAERGVEILTVETFQSGATDFSEQLTDIMNADPDVIFVSALASEMLQIIVQGRAIGIPDDVPFIVPDAITRDEVQKGGEAIEGSITFTSWTSLSNAPGNQDFIQKYRTKYGIEPEPWAAQAYATLYILANAIANAPSTDSAAIRDALARTKDFPTILGNFSFDPNGEAMYDPVVLIVKAGELQLFE